MSSRIREGLVDLERDVASVRLASPAAVRARGEALRRRRVAGAAAAVAVGLAVTGVVSLPVFRQSMLGEQQAAQVAAEASSAPPSASSAPPPPGCTAVHPSSPPTKSPPEEAMKDPFPDSRTAKVFLDHTATPGDRAAIEAKLRSLPVITSLDFVDHQTAWRSFVKQFCDSPDLVAATSPDSLPESFHLVLKQPGDLATVRSALAGLAGVGEMFHTSE